MNRVMACMLLSGAMVCGTQVLASEENDASANSNASPTLTNSHAIHKKLMKDCMEQQRTQGNSSSASDTDARKACESQVKSQMQQMNNAGTIPPSSVPQRSGNAGNTTGSGTSSNDMSSSPQR